MTPQPSRNPLLDMEMLDISMLLVCVIVAVAAVWLQWSQFKKNYPSGQTQAPFAVDGLRNRWRAIYWREVRAMLGFAFISLLMFVGVTLYYSAVTVATTALLLFWLGMFFYNLWLAQWYAWRLATKRRR